MFDGKGESFCTAKDYTDFEMLVDWKIEKGGDSREIHPEKNVWSLSEEEISEGFKPLFNGLDLSGFLSEK